MKYSQRSWALPNYSKHNEANFFDDINGYIVLKSRSDAEISRSGDFCAGIGQ